MSSGAGCDLVGRLGGVKIRRENDKVELLLSVVLYCSQSVAESIQ